MSCRENVGDVHHPTWQNVLRYAVGPGEEIILQQGCAKLPYGFEYLGCDVCALTSTFSLHSNVFSGLMHAAHTCQTGTLIGAAPRCMH